MTWVPIPAGCVDEHGAAGILDVPVTRLRSWRAQRIGPAVTRRGGRFIYNQASLLRWARPIDSRNHRQIERHTMTQRKRKAEARRTSTLNDGTAIQEVAARLTDRLSREVSTGRSDLLRREREFLREQVLDLAPTNLKDAVVLALVAFDVADGLSQDDDRQDDAGRVATALRRLIRFLADASGVDLRDAAAEDFIFEAPDLAEFPELAA
jgi:hypothetical protein